MEFTPGMVLGTTPLTGPVDWLIVGELRLPPLFTLGMPFSGGLLSTPVVPRVRDVPVLLMAPFTPVPFELGSPGCWTPNCAWQVVICETVSLEQSVPGGNSLVWAGAGAAETARAAPARTPSIPPRPIIMWFIAVLH
jgi:hypothetical protein